MRLTLQKLLRRLSTGTSASAAAVASARVFSLIAALVQLPLLTRYLAPQEYALVGAAIALATYVSLLTGDPYTLAFRRFPGTQSKPGSYQYALRRILMMLSMVAALALIVGWLTKDLSTALGIAGWAAGLASMRIVSTAWLMWERPWKYTLNLIASTGTRTLLLVGLIVVGQQPATALGVAGIASLIAALAFGPKGLPHSEDMRRPWPRYFGLSLTIASLGTTLATNFDRAVMPYLTEISEAGRYVAMNQVANLTLGAILGIFQMAYFPAALKHWNQGNQARAIRSTQSIIWVSATLSALSIFGLALFGRQIVDPILGPGYYDPKYVLPLLAAAGLFGIGQQIAWSHQFKVNALRIRRAGYLVGGLSVVLVLLLVPNYGAIGAAAACVIAFFAYALAMLAGSGVGANVGVALIFMTMAGLTCLIDDFSLSVSVSAALSVLIGAQAWAHKRSSSAFSDG